MTSTKSAEQTRSPSNATLPDAPEKVWRALTVPELLAAWMMPNDIKPETGSRFAFAGPDAPIECEVLDAEPGRLLRYSWRERSSAMPTGDGQHRHFHARPHRFRRHASAHCP